MLSSVSNLYVDCVPNDERVIVRKACATPSQIRTRRTTPSWGPWLQLRLEDSQFRAPCLSWPFLVARFIDPPPSKGLTLRSFLWVRGYSRPPKPNHERTTSTTMTIRIVPSTPSPALFFKSPNVISYEMRGRLYLDWMNRLALYSLSNPHSNPKEWRNPARAAVAERRCPAG
jgi:hypothetical protein